MNKEDYQLPYQDNWSKIDQLTISTANKELKYNIQQIDF